MKKKLKLEWYAFEMDSNSRKIVRINILNEYTVEYLLKKIKRNKANTYEKIKEAIKTTLMSDYWSRTEHEVLVSGLFDDDLENSFKMDVWFQLEPNLDRIVEYFISETNLKIELKNEK